VRIVTFFDASAGDIGGEQNGHPESVAATVEMSARKACERHPYAADILYFCAFLQPDVIPDEILGLTVDETVFREGVVALRRYSLITFNDQMAIFSVHRLVQSVVADSLSPEARTQWRNRIVEVLYVTFCIAELFFNASTYPLAGEII